MSMRYRSETQHRNASRKAYIPLKTSSNPYPSDNTPNNDHNHVVSCTVQYATQGEYGD
jgi:hypothetical protein